MSLLLFLIAAFSQAAEHPNGAAANDTARSPASAAGATNEEEPAPQKTVKMTCNAGPLRKVLGGQPWMILSCSDNETLLVLADEGNPAAPFLFFLWPEKGNYGYSSLTSKRPAAVEAARIELSALSPVAMAMLVAETKGETAANATAPAEAQVTELGGEYEEARIGAWSLRTDRKARTFGVIWMDTGVIELAARTSDKKAEIVIRDNGARVTASFWTPNCGAAGHISGYEGETRRGVPLAGFAREIPGFCPGSGYEAEIQSWLRDFPAAMRAMKSRASALYGQDLTRCLEPDHPPFEQPPHPYCGFAPPEIGENHKE